MTNNNQQMNKSSQNIFLIGPMGSGKTTIGRHLAKMFNLEFHDCDHELEHLTGASVNLIFDVEGEAGFRIRETQLLKQLCSKNGVLVATGGGVVCSEENRDLLRSEGFVIYLKTSVENQLKRLRSDKSRPLLQAKNRRQRLMDMARERNPLYHATADMVFSTRNSSIHTTAKKLSNAISTQMDSFKLEKPNADS
jgi:shikimate kinase